MSNGLLAAGIDNEDDGEVLRQTVNVCDYLQAFGFKVVCASEKINVSKQR